jgi:type I restriction enzyme S subunit
MVPNDVLPACVNQHVSIIRVDARRADPGYVLGFLTHPDVKSYIESFNAGGSRRAVTKGHIESFRLPLPPLSEQHVIAHVLGTLDDKIELNRRINETLEAMARALFKSWFVDFDPVRAKAEGRDPGLPKHIADLFPDSFEDSELGEIPTGWTAVHLPDVIEVNPGRTIKKGDVAPYLDMANMPTRGHSPDHVFDRAFGSGMRFKNGDTLVARITPCLENGKTAYVDFLLDEQIGWGSTEYIVLRPKPPLPLEFAYCLARSSRFREFAIQSMTGSSGRQRVPAESLYHYLLVTPSPEIAEHFGHVAGALLSRASNSARESRALAAVRDSLLPKLVSGEIRIKNPEEIVRTLRPQEVAAIK